MEQKTKRPLLLTGLIIALVSFSVLLISGIITIALISDALSAAGHVDGSTTVMVLLVAYIILAACGVVFSSISLPRWKLAPELFAHKKGMLITTFVFCVLFVVWIIIGLFTSVDVLSIIIAAALIVSAVFIMIDICKNSKLLKNAPQQNVGYDAPQYGDSQQFVGQQYNNPQQFGGQQYNNQYGPQNPYNNQYGQYQQNPYNNQYGQYQQNPYNNQFGQYQQNPYNNQYGQYGPQNGAPQQQYNNQYNQNAQQYGIQPEENPQTVESFEQPNNDDNDAQ